jgi:hypothetical protein
MQSVEVVVARDPRACWQAFTDPATLPAWVPGLRRARVIANDSTGLPAEILFELASSLTYSLVYTYDVARLEVAWQPRSGKRDAVAGSARFEAAEGGGTKIVYALKQGEGRSTQQREVGAGDPLLAAFVRFVGG